MRSWATSTMRSSKCAGAPSGERPNAPNDSFATSMSVWENVADADLEAAIQAEDLAGGLRRLVDGAKARGGPECNNLSVAAARVRAAPSSRIAPHLPS